MTGPSSLTRTAGLLGGLCWLAQAVLDAAGGPAALVNGLHWGGLALVVLGLLGLGAGLVSGLPTLRVVVAVCLVALVLSLREVGHQQAPDAVVDGVLGALLALWCAVGLARARRTTQRPVRAVRPVEASRRATRERRSGSHAA